MFLKMPSGTNTIRKMANVIDERPVVEFGAPTIFISEIQTSEREMSSRFKLKAKKLQEHQIKGELWANGYSS